MDKIIRAMYPDCDKDPKGCFERYLRDRVENMKKHNIQKLRIGTFDDSYFEQFKNVERDYGDEFWWSPQSWNVGTVKDRHVYSFTLFWMRESQQKFMHHVDRLMDGLSSTSFPSSFGAAYGPVYGPHLPTDYDTDTMSEKDFPVMLPTVTHDEISVSLCKGKDDDKCEDDKCEGGKKEDCESKVDGCEDKKEGGAC